MAEGDDEADAANSHGNSIPDLPDILSPAHTMRFLSSVGRRDDEKTIVAWCVRTKDNCRPLILQTRQLLDRFEKRIGPTIVAWCVRVKDICCINRPVQDTQQVRYLLQLLSAVVCAANCRRVVCAVIQQSSHGVCGSFNNRRRRLHRRRSSGQQKLHGVCLALGPPL